MAYAFSIMYHVSYISMLVIAKYQTLIHLNICSSAMMTWTTICHLKQKWKSSVSQCITIPYIIEKNIHTLRSRPHSLARDDINSNETFYICNNIAAGCSPYANAWTMEQFEMNDDDDDDDKQRLGLAGWDDCGGWANGRTLVYVV